MNDPRHLLGRQIAVLAAAAQHCPLARLVTSLDAIRHTARVEGLTDVAMLASHLESAIGAHGRSAIILSYLDAMAAALAAPDGDPASSHDEAWLASVAVRFAN